VWNSGGYYRTAEAVSARPFSRNRALLSQGFTNSPEFDDELTDIGTGFTHAKKRLRLNDVFVYPSLRHRKLQRDTDGQVLSPTRVRSKELVEFVIAQHRLFILGPGRSGRTALARSLYRALQTEMNLVPVIIDGADLTTDRLSPIINAAYKRQYSDESLERFNQLPAKQRAIIIDNLDRAKVRQGTLSSVIDYIEAHFGKIIIFAQEHFDIGRVITGRNRGLFFDFRQYHIDELSRVLRAELIARWVSLGRGEWDEDARDREIKSREEVVNTLLGKQLLPAHPIIILAILQTLDSTRNLNTASGSYGELYEALITDRLATVSRKPTDLGTFYTVIARVAFFLYEREAESLPPP
jgi:hypothetical protein